MKSLLTLLFCWILLPPSDFKNRQLGYERVQAAYLEKGLALEIQLKSKNVSLDNLELYLQAFKRERVLAVWVKNRNDKKFQLLKEIPFCAGSGGLGPKNQRGDYQIPEGFYFIDRFHPESLFHLSLGLNYPNAADRARNKAANLGGDIFLHGRCQSAGCIAITDTYIKELYILAVEARENGQEQIPVHIFPTRLSDENLATLKLAAGQNKELIAFWQQLKPGYDWFERNRELPALTISKTGTYQLK